MKGDFFMVKIFEYETLYQEDIIKMILKIQREEYNIPITINEQQDLKDIENFYQRDGEFWIAVYEDEVVGTIAIKNIDNGNAVLRKMFVRKEYRGKDKEVSSKLLSKLLDWARQNQLCKIFLGTTTQFLAAHRFYEKNGFVEISKKELPDDFPVMEVDKKFYCYDLQ